MSLANMWYVWQYERCFCFLDSSASRCSAQLAFQTNLLDKGACLQIMKYWLSVIQIIYLIKKSMSLAEGVLLYRGTEHESFSLQCLHERLKTVVRNMVVILVQKSLLALIGILNRD